jgi:hypothetical protein
MILEDDVTMDPLLEPTAEACARTGGSALISKFSLAAASEPSKFKPKTKHKSKTKTSKAHKKHAHKHKQKKHMELEGCDWSSRGPPSRDSQSPEVEHAGEVDGDHGGQERSNHRRRLHVNKADQRLAAGHNLAKGHERIRKRQRRHEHIEDALHTLIEQGVNVEAMLQGNSP